LPKIGWLRVRGLALPEHADLKQVAVTQEPDGWHVSVQFEALAKTYAVPTLPPVGLDVGLDALATLSDGTKIEHPRLAKKAAKRIRRLNRERDRRRKGSVNRRRTVARLARAHRYVKNARADHVHKATRRLVDTYEGFAVEDLSLRGMMRTRMAGSLADAGSGGFLRVLRYKAEWAGRAWRVLPRFQRSTGVCPDCGLVGPKLPLSVRTWACDGCGAVHDRDVAAAKVILGGATAAQATGVGQALPEPAPAKGRKRSSAVRGGVRASARASHGGPLSNVAQVASRD
ncbi:MAG: transposase, partial [Elioraea sp.]|nr:transposase [Elioraea sp.]